MKISVTFFIYCNIYLMILIRKKRASGYIKGKPRNVWMKKYQEGIYIFLLVMSIQMRKGEFF